MWMVQAFTERPINDLWWLTPDRRHPDDRDGVLGQRGSSSSSRAYTLLIFAGVWAMTSGLIDIVRAFQIREAGQALGRHLASMIVF